MGRDAVEEPAVVADHDGTAREGLERVLEGAQSVDVEVVGGFVEQENVASGAQKLGQMNAVAFTTREVAHLLLLVAALEVERCDVGATVDLAVAHLEVIDPVGDLLVDGLVGVE